MPSMCLTRIAYSFEHHNHVEFNLNITFISLQAKVLWTIRYRLQVSSITEWALDTAIYTAESLIGMTVNLICNQADVYK